MGVTVYLIVLTILVHGRAHDVVPIENGYHSTLHECQAAIAQEKLRRKSTRCAAYYIGYNWGRIAISRVAQ